MHMEDLVLGLFKFGIPIVAFIYLIRQGLRFIYDNDLLDISLFKFLSFVLVSFVWVLLALPLIIFLGLWDSIFARIILVVFLIIIFVGMILGIFFSLVVFILIISNISDYLLSLIAKLFPSQKFKELTWEEIFSQYSKLSIMFITAISLNESIIQEHKKGGYVDTSFLFFFRTLFVNVFCFTLYYIFDHSIFAKMFDNGLFSWPNTQDLVGVSLITFMLFFIFNRLSLVFLGIILVAKIGTLLLFVSNPIFMAFFDPSVYFWRAESFRKKGNYKDAVRNYKKVAYFLKYSDEIEVISGSFSSFPAERIRISQGEIIQKIENFTSL